MNPFVRFLNKIRRIGDVVSFAEGLFEKILLGCVVCVAELCSTLGISARMPCRGWRMRNNGQHFRLYTRGDFSDIQLFRDIFLKHPYDSVAPFSVNTVVDFGANIGVTPLFFYSCFPNARIVAVEANPHLIPVLQKNMAQVSQGQVLHVAITNHGGKEVLHVDAASVGSSIADRKRASQIGQVAVPAMTFSEFVKTSCLDEIDILKIDIEGAEWAVFTDPTFAQHVRYVTGEIHEDISKHSIEEFRKVLEVHFVVEMTKTNQEGRYIVKAFRKEASLLG